MIRWDRKDDAWHLPLGETVGYLSVTRHGDGRRWVWVCHTFANGRTAGIERRVTGAKAAAEKAAGLR